MSTKDPKSPERLPIGDAVIIHHCNNSSIPKESLGVIESYLAGGYAVKTAKGITVYVEFGSLTLKMMNVEEIKKSLDKFKPTEEVFIFVGLKAFRIKEVSTNGAATIFHAIEERL